MLDGRARGGEKEQKEQSVTTEDLHKTIFVDLAIEETPYSDHECLEYEREYLPLHVFANSYVGNQTLIFEDRVRHACAWDHSLGEDTREEGESQGLLQEQGPAERDNQSTRNFGQMNEKTNAAIVAQDLPESVNGKDPELAAQHGERLSHVQGASRGASSNLGTRSTSKVDVSRDQVQDQGVDGERPKERSWSEQQLHQSRDGADVPGEGPDGDEERYQRLSPEKAPVCAGVRGEWDRTRRSSDSAAMPTRCTRKCPNHT